MTVPRKAMNLDDILGGEWDVGLPDDTIWVALKRDLPEALSEETDARLREAIRKCLAQLAARRSAIFEGAQLAALVRSPGRGQPSPAERLSKHLTAALEAWNDMGGNSASVPSYFDGLEAMAYHATHQLANWRARKQETVKSPWPPFVRAVAAALRTAGLRPGVTGTGYDYDRYGTWFQKFVRTLNAALPIMLREPSRSSEAFDARTAKALRGDPKPG
jgi:hypothetical protein